MKKLLFVAAAAIFGFTSVSAQEESTGGFSNGDLFISGTVGFNSSKTGDLDSNSFDFSPSVGYFVSDNVALELGAWVGSTENGSNDKTSTYGVDLGATYFFTPADQFSFTVGAGIGYGSDKNEPNGGAETTVDVIGFAVSPGVSYFISDNFALRASIAALSYESSKPDTSGADSTNTFGLNVDLSDINFGIVYKF